MNENDLCRICKMGRLIGSAFCAKCRILQSKEQAKEIVCLGRELKVWAKVHDQDIIKIEMLKRHGVEQAERIVGLCRKIRELIEDRENQEYDKRGYYGQKE